MHIKRCLAVTAVVILALGLIAGCQRPIFLEDSPTLRVTGSPAASPFDTGTPTHTKTDDPTQTPDTTPTWDDPTQTPTEEPSATPAPTKSPSFEPIVPTALFHIGPWQPEKQPPEGYALPYAIEVDVANCVVNIYKKNAQTGHYDEMVNRFVCSPGKGRNTPEEVFEVGAYYKSYKSFKNNWMYFPESDHYARYSTRIYDKYMFHSFLFYKRDASTPMMDTYYKLGTKASSGCIRLLVEHAKWIYDYVPKNTFCNITYKKTPNTELKYAMKVPQVYGDPVSENSMQTPPPPSTATVKPMPTPTHTPTATPTAIITPTPQPTSSTSPSSTDVGSETGLGGD